MSWFEKYAKSSVGAKQVMAVTALLLVGFLIMHMIGNLQLFAGREAVNSYAAMLKGLGPLLWVARIILLMATVAHVASAIRVVKLNRAARPIAYKKVATERSSISSRSMLISGLVLAAFLIFHLVHFTLGGGPMSEAFNSVDAQGRHDVYTMTVLGFQNPGISIFYIVAMGLLCMHLSHGVTSFFQTLGINHPKYNGAIKMTGPVIAGILLVGNCSMPIAVLAKVVTL